MYDHLIEITLGLIAVAAVFIITRFSTLKLNALNLDTRPKSDGE